MSDWLNYDDFVELVKDRHLQGFSGLITGVSDERHSFQIGFETGEIVLLTYRIKKGQAALRMLTQVEQVKISEYPNADVPDGHEDDLDTVTALARLVARTSDDTTTITRLDEKNSSRDATDITIPGMLDDKMRKVIEAAAREHFGPVGAMICAQQLDNPVGDVRTIVLSIAHEADASEEDTRAFLETVSKS